MRLVFVSIALMTGVFCFGQENELEESKKRGSEIYADFCVVCHLPSGLGMTGVFPPLAKSDYLKNKDIKKIIRGVKYGLQGEITVNDVKYNGVMPPLGLSDDEVADVLNYVTNSWGNQNKNVITQEDVASIKKEE